MRLFHEHVVHARELGFSDGDIAGGESRMTNGAERAREHIPRQRATDERRGGPLFGRGRTRLGGSRIEQFRVGGGKLEKAAIEQSRRKTLNTLPRFRLCSWRGEFHFLFIPNDI